MYNLFKRKYKYNFIIRVELSHLLILVQKNIKCFKKIFNNIYYNKL